MGDPFERIKEHSFRILGLILKKNFIENITVFDTRENKYYAVLVVRYSVRTPFMHRSLFLKNFHLKLKDHIAKSKTSYE